MPTILPCGSEIGDAEQVRKWLAETKCSKLCTTMGVCVTRAVPMALVPRICSDHIPPGWRETLRALPIKPGSPSEWSTTPVASARTTMLEVWMICS